MKDPAETLRHWGQTLGWLRARSSQLTLMKDPAETLRHWGQTFGWLGALTS